MLRPFRASDIPAYMALYRAHFREEAEVLLTDASAFQRVMERGFTRPTRFLLGLLALFGRPILDFLADEEDGRLAGATFVFYRGPSGYISSVVVDTPYRRRGLARAMVGEAERKIRRRGRRNSVLEVISTNAPARALYDSMGYREVRRTAWYVLDLPDGARSLPIPSEAEIGRGIRALRPQDGVPLSDLARSAQPEADRRVRPVTARSFRVPPAIAWALGSETRGYVWEANGRAMGFARSTAAGAASSGNLVPPLVDPIAGEEAAGALLSTALAFFREHPVPRIVAEAALDDRATVRRLEERGFRIGLTMETLAKPLDAPA